MTSICLQQSRIVNTNLAKVFKCNILFKLYAKNIFFKLDALCGAVFRLLQTLLPSGKQKSYSSSGQFKSQKNYSVKESQEAFIMFCETETIYEEYVKTKILSESAIPPYITIVGSLLQPKTFFVGFENTTYELPSLVKAIDVCLKAYHLFNLEYVPATRQIWQFVNMKFYNLPAASAYPAVHVLNKNICGNISFRNSSQIITLMFFILFLK